MELKSLQEITIKSVPSALEEEIRRSLINGFKRQVADTRILAG